MSPLSKPSRPAVIASSGTHAGESIAVMPRKAATSAPEVS